LLPIEDVFSISGRGTVVTGRVESGIVKVGEEVEIIGIRDTVKQRVQVLKCSANCLMKVEPVITSVCCYVVRSVMTLSVVKYWLKPGSIKPHTKFEAEVYVCLKKKVAVIRHFSKDTVHSFISERQT
jgi:elongation factor Tu